MHSLNRVGAAVRPRLRSTKRMDSLTECYAVFCQRDKDPDLSRLTQEDPDRIAFAQTSKNNSEKTAKRGLTEKRKCGILRMLTNGEMAELV